MSDYLAIELTSDEICQISALALAHVGDAVFELMVRTWLVKSGRATAKGLHKAAITVVSAPAQARAVEKLLPLLTEEEQGVFRRGRNTRVNSVPHRSSLADYHAATGLESLFGYLYLRGETTRLNELFAIVVDEKSC